MYGGSLRPIAGRVRQRFVMFQRVGWVERSDTHQLHLMEMMGFAGSTHPTYLLADRGVIRMKRKREMLGHACGLEGRASSRSGAMDKQVIVWSLPAR